MDIDHKSSQPFASHILLVLHSDDLPFEFNLSFTFPELVSLRILSLDRLEVLVRLYLLH